MPAKTNAPVSTNVELKKRHPVIFCPSFIVAIVAVIAALGFFWLYRQANAKLKNTNAQLISAQNELQTFQNDPTAQARIETKDLVSKVGQLIILPSDEDPTIATVTDLSKLQNQPFFANAQVGDKVLIYSNAKKAILYRPSTNKIIELAPLNLGDQSITSPAAAKTTKTSKPVSGQ